MYWKFYSYDLYSFDQEQALAPQEHYAIFAKAKGFDREGKLAPHRKKSDAILMEIKRQGRAISLIAGKHVTERNVQVYRNDRDELTERLELDNNYEGALCLFWPDINKCAVSDQQNLRARSAIARINAVVNFRRLAWFVANPVTQARDLEELTKNYMVHEVSFEIRPVNPHTGPLGEKLDKSNKKDQIRRLIGKAQANGSTGLALNGGTLSEVNELYKSGHATIGVKAKNENGTELVIPRPSFESERSGTGRANEVRVSTPQSTQEIGIEEMTNLLRGIADDLN
jgi:hypothetical protein